MGLKTARSSLTALGGGWEGGRRREQKEKEFMDMDNMWGRAVIGGGRGYKGDKW